jgi:hypothetical protein
MNKKISTRTGIITSLVILSFILFMIQLKLPVNSPYNLLQFLILFIGIFVSCFLLYKYYAGITFIDSLTHCLKTLATILVIVIFGNSLLFFIFSPKGEPVSNLTFLIMKTIFAYSASGLFSALFSSFIFNTFTKK